MLDFKPHIHIDYPPNNKLIFEEWFAEQYSRGACRTDRWLLPFYPTSYWVNNGYANDLVSKNAAQDYIDSLPDAIKWFVICQYDDGCLIDWKGKDVLEFNMSKRVGIQIPLVCQPHPFKFKGSKKWFANFVGSKTHPIREYAERIKGKEGYYISFEPHNIETYCRIIHESMFTLCFRGYGANSFRISEALQYGSIPVYISDEFIWPSHKEDFPGIIIEAKDADRIEEILQAIEPIDVIEMQDKLQYFYETFYSYEGLFKYIVMILEAQNAPTP